MKISLNWIKDFVDLDGIETNVEEQLRIVEDERFISGDYDLTFMGNR